MTNHEQLLTNVSSQLEKAINHLDYSYQKISSPTANYNEMDDEIMETWESFSSRFARVADIFMMKYIRLKILIGDPGFNGTFRDFINKAEKMGIVDSATLWIEIRELRNVAAHEYNKEDLSGFYLKLKELCPHLLAIKNQL